MKPRLFKILIFVTALLSPIARTCIANPVPDAVAQEFRALVRTTADTGVCPDAAHLAEDFGQFGIDLLSTSEVAALERQFHVFAPILVEAQRPNHSLSFKVQAFYHKHANPTERAAMEHALREWLTAPLSSAPFHGMVRVVGPRSGVAQLAREARATAAEMLATWGDRDAAPLIANLCAPDTFGTDLGWHLTRAQKCLVDSTALSFVLPRPDRSVGLFETLENVEGANVRRGRLAYGDSLYALVPCEVTALWGMIQESTVDENTNWIGNNFCIVLEFADGVRASLSPTERGHVVYTDNTSLDYMNRLTLRSDRLWSWIADLFRRELGKETD
jgi:hypothetical protein